MITEVLLSEAAAGVAAELVNTTARRLVTAAGSRRSKSAKEALEVAQWFDTYKISNRALQCEDILRDVSFHDFEALLKDEGLHSALHTLLAARLTDAPQSEISKISTVFRLTVSGFQDGKFGGISDALFGYYDEEICVLAGRLEGAYPESLDRIRSEAFSARMIASLGAIERQLSALNNPVDPAQERDFISRYRTHLADYHGKLEPPDFQRRRRVPIDDLYVPPEISAVLRRDQPRRPISLAEFASQIDRTVLLGDPGAGKTTATTAIIYRASQDPGSLLPFLVTLREFAADDPPRQSVLEYIESRLERFYQCRPVPGVVEKLLLSGAALVVFDGLDELVDTTRRMEITAIVEQFSTEYPHARVLVTSRVVGYEEAQLDVTQFSCFRIAGFDVVRTEKYVRNWFANEEEIGAEEGELLVASFMAESSSVPDLRANPLMLALMCILYRGERSIPQNRAEVYEQCANLLFTKWDARRKIHVGLKARRHIDPALRHLAFWLFSRDAPQPAVTETELISETTAFLYGRGFEYEEDAESAAREFITFCKGRAWVFSDAGTTAKGLAQYTFTHRTFLEYFAAAHLASTSDTPEKLAQNILPRVAKREWDVVCQLALQIKDRSSDQGAERVFQSLLANKSYRSVESRSNILKFLCACLSCTDPAPGTVRALAQEAIEISFTELEGRPLVEGLIANGSAYRSTIANVLTHHIEKLMGNGRSNERILALKFIMWFMGVEVRIIPSLTESERKFWREFSDGLWTSYADAFRAESAKDAAVLFEAIHSDIISFQEFLELEGADLGMLLLDAPILWGVSWNSFFASAVGTILRSDSKVNPEKAIRLISDLGRYLMAHPVPPWFGLPDDEGVSTFYHRGPVGSEVRLDEASFLGAAVALTASAETGEASGSQIAVIAEMDLGVLSALRPFLILRASISDDPEDAPGGSEVELPDLPVPAPFSELFRGWARGQLNWTFLKE